MKRALLAVSVAVVAGVSSAGLAAQDAGARGGRGGGAITPDASGKVTVDGCVQNAPAGSGSASKYILASVRATPRPNAAGRGTADPEAAGTATEGTTPAAGTGAAGTPGATPAAGATAGRGRGGAAAPAPPIRYQLAGEEKIITPHLNHVVEIMGTLSGEPPPPARGGGPGGPGGGAATPITQTLKVESLKMVAALCS